ncbi:DUF397 domain-containing protein [Streptomyces sp. NPDC059517]|uniref:DUF397 domain-containing protein n=1 Tax=Streptomyces sp. NPDC059517 TaxID=3346855 RepID=UPI0036CB19A0
MRPMADLQTACRARPTSEEGPERPQLPWQKSSFSGDESGNCVYLAATPAGVLLRESDAPAEIIATTPARLRHLIQALKADRPADAP